MSIDGIWTGDVFGPFGWGSHGVFIMEDGRILGGDDRQYSHGTYSVSDTTVIATFTVHYYGPPRAMFGDVREENTIELEGVLDVNQIQGFIRLPSKPEFDVRIRLIKRAELPCQAMPSDGEGDVENPRSGDAAIASVRAVFGDDDAAKSRAARVG